MTSNRAMRWLGTALLALWSATTFAHGADGAAGHEVVAPVLQAAMADAGGRKGVFVTVTFAPGQASNPHFHPGSLFAYVLEGEVVSQLEGEAPVTYRAGQAWYEPPRKPHLVSKNASTTRPAKLLVWLMMNDGDEVVVPLAAKR